MTSEQLPFYIGRYRVTGQLGSGGMGVVFLATDERLHRRVAIKRLTRNPTSSNAHLRIRKEALLLAQLNHSNIVQIYDVVEERGDVALVMEYVDGCTLDQWQRERNPSLRQKIQLLRQMCNGLARAHGAGIIHRDLKADNILIDGNNTAKITDFGIAKNWREDSDLTREQHVAGSWGAMSPEQAQGLPLDNRSDLFSIGVLAYRLLCGQNPFGESGSPFTVIDRIVNSQHPPPAKLNPDLPQALCQLLDRLLAKSPDKRPLNATAVAAELDAMAQDLDTEAVNSLTRTETITAEDYHQRRRRNGLRKKVFAGSALALGSTLLMAAALTLLQPQLSADGGKGKYIAVVSPPVDEAATREARLLTSSVMNALKEALTNRHGLYLIPMSESRGVQGLPLRRQAQKLNAQMLLNPEISCDARFCDLSLEVIDTQNFSVVSSRSLSLSLSSTWAGFEQTYQQVGYLLPDHPAHGQGLRYEIAEEDYKHYLELHENTLHNPDISAHLDALEALQKKAPLFPPLYELYSQEAWGDRYNNLNMEAAGRLRQFLDRVPAQIADAPEVIVARLELAEMEADWQEADQQLERLKTAMTDKADFYHRKSMNLHLRGEYQQALEASNRSLERRTSIEYLVQKAYALSFLGDIEAARPVLHQVLEIDGSYTSALTLLAAIELDSGNTAEVSRLLTSVAREQLTTVDIYNLCTAQYLDRNFSEADPCFEELLQINPNDAEPLLFRAEMARARGREPLARELTEQAMWRTQDSEGWENKLTLAQAYAQLGRHKEAVETLIKIRRQARDDIYVNHIRAQIYITTGDLVSAEAHIRRTLEMGLSPAWYRTERFARICTHSNFADLRGDFPELCGKRQQNTQVARK